MRRTLVVPAVSLADDGGGSTPATAEAKGGGHAAALLERLSNRLDRRFERFSKHCLVQNAPDRCSRAANRFVRRLDRLQRILNRVEGKIKEKCGAANPPARCVNAPKVTGAIDALLAGDTRFDAGFALDVVRVLAAADEQLDDAVHPEAKVSRGP